MERQGDGRRAAGGRRPPCCPRGRQRPACAAPANSPAARWCWGLGELACLVHREPAASCAVADVSCTAHAVSARSASGSHLRSAGTLQRTPPMIATRRPQPWRSSAAGRRRERESGGAGEELAGASGVVADGVRPSESILPAAATSLAFHDRTVNFLW